MCPGEIKQVHHILVTSHFAYVELWITRSISPIPLDFEIERLTCMRVLNLQRDKLGGGGGGGVEWGE